MEREERTGGGTGTAVERTRRGVEMMEMEEDNNIPKASAARFKEKLTSAAKEGWSKVMNRLRGKELKREGSELVVEKRTQVDGGKVLSEEMRGEWLDESEVGRVDLEVMVDEREADSLSVKSNESKKTKAGFGFLETMEDEGRDEELERVRNSGRKRKRGEPEMESKKGLIGMAG